VKPEKGTVDWRICFNKHFSDTRSESSKLFKKQLFQLGFKACN